MSVEAVGSQNKNQEKMLDDVMGFGLLRRSPADSDNRQVLAAAPRLASKSRIRVLAPRAADRHTAG